MIGAQGKMRKYMQLTYTQTHAHSTEQDNMMNLHLNRKDFKSLVKYLKVFTGSVAVLLLFVEVVVWGILNSHHCLLVYGFYPISTLSNDQTELGGVVRMCTVGKYCCDLHNKLIH